MVITPSQAGLPEATPTEPAPVSSPIPTSGAPSQQLEAQQSSPPGARKSPLTSSPRNDSPTDHVVRENSSGTEDIAKSSGGMGSAVRAVTFWGSLAATAIPGFFGKNSGISPDFKHWNWITDHIILGAIPVKSKFLSGGDHLQKLKNQLVQRDMQIGMVVCALTDDEIKGFGINIVDFVQEEDWKATLSVDTILRLPMNDFTADISYATLNSALAKIREVTLPSEQYPKGRAVYIHCKAGKGRSWMVATSFLIKYHHLSYEDACALVKMQRPQVEPNEHQQHFVKMVAQFFQEQDNASFNSAVSSFNSRTASFSAGPAAVPDYAELSHHIVTLAAQFPPEARADLIRKLQSIP